MTRRVVDARTRIGMLRSLGFATGSIMGVYLLYSGSAAELIDYDGVVTMFLTEDAAVRVEGMLQALVYIVLLVIVCSGALAFIVLFNLTNINVIEHLREIATVKVLGFSPRETAAYVFRENVLLTGLGALLGLPPRQGAAVHLPLCRGRRRRDVFPPRAHPHGRGAEIRRINFLQTQEPGMALSAIPGSACRQRIVAPLSKFLKLPKKFQKLID